MKNNNNNNNNATTSSNQPDNQTSNNTTNNQRNQTRTNQIRTNQTRTNQPDNLANNYSNLNANGQQISWLIFDSGKTPYKIAKATGVPDGNLYHVKNGDRLIENLSLSVASKLTAYAIKLQGQQDNNTNDNN